MTDQDVRDGLRSVLDHQVYPEAIQGITLLPGQVDLAKLSLDRPHFTASLLDEDYSESIVPRIPFGDIRP